MRPVGDKYEEVAGERWLRAALAVGLTEVPVTVRVMTDKQASEYALMENLQRQDLSPVEETEGILQLRLFDTAGKSTNPVLSLSIRDDRTKLRLC